MPRILLGDPRLRILDSNGNPPGNINPYRLDFFESDATTAKAVYYSLTGGTGAQIVPLDAEGYVPVSGIWLDVGIYTMVVKKKIANTGVDAVDWIPLWTFYNLQGATADAPSNDTRNVQFIGGVNTLRNLAGGGLVYLTGYYNVADGGEGPLVWVEDSTQVDDGGAFFKPIAQSPSTPGRWHRLWTEGEMDVRKWGAITGQADVSAQIILAMNYCATTANDSGKTLLFPHGAYNLGTAHLVLNGVGHDITHGTDRPVAYHLQANAVFRATMDTGDATSTIASASIEFAGPTIVDGTSAHSSQYVQLIFTGVVNGGTGVRPEWWQTVGGVFEDDLQFNHCWAGSGDNDIIIDGQYTLGMPYDIMHTRSGGGKPTLIFKYNSSITTLSAGHHIEIGNIVCEPRTSSHRAIKGVFNAYTIYAERVEASWFDISTVARFKLLAQALNFSQTTMFWDDNFTWDANYDCVSSGGDYGAGITHTFGTSNQWFVNNAHVQITNMVPPARQFVSFASPDNVGTFNVGNIWDFNAVWFGAVGPSVITQMRHFFRTCIKYQIGMEFNDYASTVTDGISIVVPNGNNVRIRNLRLTLTDPSKTLFAISDAGAGSNTSVRFKGCELNTAYAAVPASLISCATTFASIDDSTFVYGTISLRNQSDTHVRNSTFYTCPSYINTNDGQILETGCSHSNSPVTYLGVTSAKTFDNVYSKGNVFSRTTGTADIFFNANGHNVVAHNVRIDNTNCTVADVTTVSSSSGWKNLNPLNPAHPYGAGPWHDIKIEGQTNGSGHKTTSFGHEDQYRSESMTFSVNSFRLNGVTTSKAKITSIYGNTRSYANNANTYHNSPPVVWAQDYYSSGDDAAHCRVQLNYYIIQNWTDIVLYLDYQWEVTL